MGLLMASLYDKVFSLVEEIKASEKIVKVAGPIIQRKFDREVTEIDYSVSTLVSDMYRSLGELEGDKRSIERLKKDYEVRVEKILERIEEVKSLIMREIELATTVLSESIRRMPDAGTDMFFLAARISEVPNKISYMPESYLDVLLNILRSLLPPLNGRVRSINDEVDEIVDSLRDVYMDLKESELKEEIRDLMDILRYLKFISLEFKQLAPGALRYLEDLRRSSIIFPRGRSNERSL